MKNYAEIRKALIKLYQSTAEPAKRAKAANNQDLISYFRGVQNTLAAVCMEIGFNVINGEDFDK